MKCGTASNNFTIYQPASPDGTLRIGNGNTGTTSAQVVLTSAGNVGIGTSSPAAPLQVNGATGSVALIVGNTGETTRLEVTATTNVGATLDITDGGSNRNMMFAISGTERARIDSSGNLLVQKTSSNLTVTGVEWKVSDFFAVTHNSGDSGDRVVLLTKRWSKALCCPTWTR